MAFSATSILTVVTSANGGSDNNAGGFNPGNANFASDLTTDANTGNTSAPVVSSASYAFVAGDAGYRVFIKSGTNWTPGWYTIASVSGGKATLTASVGSATLYNGTFASTLNTAVGCATVGTPTSGTFGIDYSFKAGAASGHYGDSFANGVDGASSGTTNFTSAGGAIGKNWVGNYVNITAGVSWTVQRCEVVSTSGTTATMDKNVGGASSGTWRLGGSLATPGQATATAAPGAYIAGVDVFIMAGTYTLSGTTVNTSGGPISMATAGTAGNLGEIEGFAAIPRDMGTPPVLSHGAQTSVTGIGVSATEISIRNVTIDGNGASGSLGINISGSRTLVDRCKVQNCVSTSFTGSAASTTFIRCVCASGTAAVNNFSVSGSKAFWCESYGCTGHGFSVSTGTLVGCLSYSNTGTADGFLITSGSPTLIGCVAYANGRHGFDISVSTNNGGVCLINCYSEGHTGGYEYTDISGAAASVSLINCGGYQSSGSGLINTTNLIQPTLSFVTLTSTAFNNAASNDFSLNSTSTGGGLLTSAGFPGTFPRGTTVGMADIGVPSASKQGGRMALGVFG
jgi:hypothetical protein